jgi:putative ubiquitin-RnfH superfamily antitoxin RatB of RatAB toxin-antitoxin module
MRVELVYALPERAEQLALELPAGATARDALAAAGFTEVHAVGVFGKRVALDQALREGDRVEIYRPLAVDPKEARRRRARALPAKKR